MGKNNKQRRAAKAKAKAKARARARQHASAAGPSRSGPSRSSQRPPYGSTQPPSSVADRFVAAAYAARGPDPRAAARLLEDLADEPAEQVATAAAVILEDVVGRTWHHGWQPADLARYVTKQLGTPASGVIGAVIGAQSTSYAELGGRVAPRWMAQLEELDAPLGRLEPGSAYLLTQVEGGWVATLTAAAQVLALLVVLPQLPPFTDPPSAWRAGDGAVAASLPAGVLAKVRALLAKAESTAFDAEAEALTAKAQELMTRHRIDRALLGADGEDRDGPTGRRIGIDDPYGQAKAVLLSGIAEANGCRCVWSKPLGFCSIIGFVDELDAVEELFTSLLVQANAALRREGSKVDAAGRSRTTRFRRSFLLAFAQRIGQRLHEAAHDTVAAASDEAPSLLPVLAARDDATNEAFTQAFPDIDTYLPSATDAEGWHAGTAFGDRAELSLSRPLHDPT